MEEGKRIDYMPVLAWLSGISWRGILTGVKVKDLSPKPWADCVLTLSWTVPDSREDGDWEALIVVPLDLGQPETWNRTLMNEVADVVGQELAEAVWRDGVPIADPHASPPIWPWRAQDRGIER